MERQKEVTLYQHLLLENDLFDGCDDVIVFDKQYNRSSKVSLTSLLDRIYVNNKFLLKGAGRKN